MKHGATLKFTCAGGLRILNEQVMFSESLADPEGLYRQVRNQYSVPLLPPPSPSHVI